MIDKQQAVEIAERHLATLAQRLGEPLEVIEFQEKPLGWVFFYEAKSYLETRDISSMLAGNGPLLVTRDSGALHVLSTSKPLEEAIEDACSH